jgi:hypothetical protein
MEGRGRKGRPRESPETTPIEAHRSPGSALSTTLSGFESLPPSRSLDRRSLVPGRHVFSSRRDSRCSSLAGSPLPPSHPPPRPHGAPAERPPVPDRLAGREPAYTECERLAWPRLSHSCISAMATIPLPPPFDTACGFPNRLGPVRVLSAKPGTGRPQPLTNTLAPANRVQSSPPVAACERCLTGLERPPPSEETPS